MKIVTFGEIMMRLSTPNSNKLIQSKNVDLSFAGSEANVAVDLNYWGIDTRFITTIPENTLGEMVLTDLNQHKVDTKYIRKAQHGRLGLLFLETGSNQRSSKVLYDREHSAFSIEKFDKAYFKEAFYGCNWFHWSGITAGLNKVCIDNLKIALKTAKELGLTISCDLNYRSTLWNYGEKPQDVMPDLLADANVILGNEEDAVIMLGINNPGINIDNGDLETDSFFEICNSIFNKFPNCETIGFSRREALSANHSNWSAILARRDLFFESQLYEIKNIVDRVGTGDSFSAGIIYGLNYFQNDYKRTLEFATAASCLKHSINGDYCLAKTNEIMELLNGNTSGRIKR